MTYSEQNDSLEPQRLDKEKITDPPHPLRYPDDLQIDSHLLNIECPTDISSLK